MIGATRVLDSTASGNDLGTAATIDAATSAAPRSTATLSLRRESLFAVAPSPNQATDQASIDARGATATAAAERFVDVTPIARGGEGEVFRAYDRDLGRVVAIKRAHRIDLARFAVEVRIASALEHPSIVPIHDVGIDEEGRPYLIMRFVDGEPLSTILARLAAGDAETHETFCFERRMQLFRRLCEAVEFAHARGVIHCDIKPTNVLVGRFGEVFLTDWGIARSQHNRGNEPHAGTPEYMAPEQVAGGAIDARADVYGLCALLYELLTLRPYLERGTIEETLRAVSTHAPMHPSDVRCEHQQRVPMDLGWFTLQGLEKDRERRYPSVAAMLARLDDRAEGRVPIQCSQTLLKRSLSETTRLFERRPAMLPVVVLALVVGVALWLAR